MACSALTLISVHMSMLEEGRTRPEAHTSLAQIVRVLLPVKRKAARHAWQAVPALVAHTRPCVLRA